jgi:hypothetical protein
MHWNNSPQNWSEGICHEENEEASLHTSEGSYSVIESGEVGQLKSTLSNISSTHHKNKLERLCLESFFRIV